MFSIFHPAYILTKKIPSKYFTFLLSMSDSYKGNFKKSSVWSRHDYNHLEKKCVRACMPVSNTQIGNTSTCLTWLFLWKKSHIALVSSFNCFPYVFNIFINFVVKIARCWLPEKIFSGNIITSQHIWLRYYNI